MENRERADVYMANEVYFWLWSDVKKSGSERTELVCHLRRLWLFSLIDRRYCIIVKTRPIVFT